jgi:tetratricopeptide (TPR) repeat protein
MASASLAEQGVCLIDLGQLDLAAGAYQDTIERDGKQNATRDVAMGKCQLAGIRMQQTDYPAALQGYQQGLELFLQLDEPGAVATAHHQIGMVYRMQQQFEQAESAYRQSLSIKTQQGNSTGEASSLGELANLYNAWNRPKQVVDYCQRAAAIYSQLGDKRYEGFQRNNLADTLIKLKRLQQARPELLRAIECKASFGHAAEPWKTWDILYDLEQAEGNPQAAAQARQKAIQAYADYRCDGGENHSGTGRLALAVLQAIQQGETAEIEQVIKQTLETWQNKTYLHKLQAILAGERDPALVEDNEMYYRDVAELTILLEQLASSH